MNSHWTVSAELRATDITVQLRGCRWPNPNEITVCEEPAILGINLGPRPVVGEARYCVSGDVGPFGRLGTLTFMPAGIPMHTRGNGGEHRVAAICFDPNRFETVSGVHDWDTGRLERCLDIRAPTVEHTARRLVTEAEAPGFASTLMTECVGLSLMLEIARYLRPREVVDPVRHSLSRLQLASIREMLQDSDGLPPPLCEIAAACHMSVRTLTRAFRRTTGVTIGQYAEEIRVARARVLLTSTDLPLKTISWRLGFSHPAAFSTAFRRIAGMSPIRYRSGRHGG
jgi:AraC family transcriptional regulator